MKLAKNQYEILERYEDVLNRAWKLNFLHLPQGGFSEIAGVYAELFKPLNRNQMNCGSCRLTAVKRLAEIYFADKAQMSTPKEESNTEPATEEKPRKGRKKKIEKNVENGESESEK